jgi:hypothetical protein
MVIALPIGVAIGIVCGLRAKKLKESTIQMMNEEQDKTVAQELLKVRDNGFKIGFVALILIFAGSSFWPKSPLGVGLLFSIPFALISTYGFVSARNRVHSLNLPSDAKKHLEAALLFATTGFLLGLLGLLISLARGAFAI